MEHGACIGTLQVEGGQCVIAGDEQHGSVVALGIGRYGLDQRDILLQEA
jgi:hypothetical protein